MKEINLESFRTRSRRKLKKIEPYISKILYLTSFTIFLIENLVIFPDFSFFLSAKMDLFESLFHLFVMFYFILFLFFILSLPIYFYNTIKGKIPSSDVQLFEMLSSLVLFIGSSVNNFIPQNMCIFFMGNCYPGAMIIGGITLFIIAYLTAILERRFYYSYPREKKYSKLTNQDFKRIDSSLNEHFYKIQNKIQKNLELLPKNTRELFKTLYRDLENFTFKPLEKLSDLIEELSLWNRRSNFLDRYDMKLYRAKALIDDGELEEGIKLLRTLILDSPFEGEKRPYRLAKKQHVLAVYLAKTHQYEAAYNIFKEILKNNFLILVRRLVNFDVLGDVLENLNHLEASVAAKTKNYQLLYNKLGLDKYYFPLKFFIILVVIALIALIGFFYLIIFLYIWWWF